MRTVAGKTSARNSTCSDAFSSRPVPDYCNWYCTMQYCHIYCQRNQLMIDPKNEGNEANGCNESIIDHLHFLGKFIFSLESITQSTS
jgi:hypothetical protein